MATISTHSKFRTALPPVEGVLRRSAWIDKWFGILGWVLIVLSLGVLGTLLFNLAYDGLRRISWQFLTSFPSRHAAEAGIYSAWLGSLLVMFVTAFTAIPVGIAAGVYLEEYARKNWFTSLIEINISNLASVPSIIYGLMALGLFIYKFEAWFGDPADNHTGFGQSILTAGLTLALLVLPIVIVATREAMRAIPQAIREAAYALGASRWQVIRQHLLPYSLGGILTGVIISLSRAIGETAPLVTVGALAFIAFRPPYPLEPKLWNRDEDVSLVATSETPLTQVRLQSEEGTAPARPLAPPTAAIELEIRERSQRSPGESTPTGEHIRATVQYVTPGTEPTLGVMTAAFDQVDGLSANLDEYGTLHIVADKGKEWRVVSDPDGVFDRLGIPRGGGFHGPLSWVRSPYTVLPIQMFNWTSRPDPAFLNNAAAAGLILMIATLGMNTVAITVRSRMRRKIKW